MTDWFYNFEDLRHNKILSILTIVFVFVLDLFIPLGFAVSTLYLIPMMLIPYRTVKKRVIYLFSSAITALIWMRYGAGITGNAFPTVPLIHRGIVTTILWVLTYIQIQRAKVHQELLKSEENFERNQLRFEKAESLAHVGSWRMDVSTGVMELSDEMANIIGLTSETKQIKMSDYYKLIHPEDRDYIVEATSRFHSQGKPVDLEYRIIRPDRQIRYIHGISNVAEEDVNGTKIRYGAAKDVTERKTVEIALKRERELFEGIFSSIPVMITIFDPLLQRFRFNKALHNIIGWTMEDAAEGNFVEKVYPDPEERREVSEFMQSLKPGWKEFILTSKDGTRVESSWSNIRLSDNTTIGIGIDLRQIKQTEKQLEQQRQLLETVIASIPVGVLLLKGKELTFELVNEAYKSIAPGKDMQGRKFKDVWPEVYPLLGKIYSRVLETGESYHAIDELFMIRRTPDGQLEKAYFSFSLIRVQLPETNEWGILNSAIETTERVQANETLKVSEIRLREAQKLAHIGSYILNYNNGTVEFSEELYRIFEWDPGKKITYNDVMKSIHPDDYKYVVESIERSRKEKTSLEMEYRIITPNGKIKFIHTKRDSVFDDQSSLIGAFGTSMDITAHMKQQELLKNTLNKLEHSNKELQQFAYVASHDLQEPLRMVSSYLGMLEKKYKNHLDDRAKQYIHYAVDGSKRMSNLIKDLLIYSRVTSQAKEFESVDLNKVYNDVTRDLQILINEKKAKITASNLPRLIADPIQMHQLLQNLIGNAIKFHRENTPEVIIKPKEIENGWLFSIKDNGIGIDSQYYERIFQVFQRLHEREKYPGTGIGLAVCKKIVERHGGRIWVESEISKGTTFYFTIPGNINLAAPEERNNIEIISQ